MSDLTPEQIDRAHRWPECEDFYNLMQKYRHAPVSRPDQVLAAYESVKKWIVEQVAMGIAANV